MPYYLFAVTPSTPPHRLADFDRFTDASAHAKALRGEQPAGDPARIKLVFADNLLAAEDLLLQVREPGPAGDE
jgi:hypothetical protein